jgi:hypothetical protein
MKNIRPTGEVLARQPRQQDGADELAAAPRSAPTKDRPYASTVEIEQVCAEARAESGPKWYAARSTGPNIVIRIMLSTWEPPIGIEPMTYAFARGLLPLQ